MRVLRGVPAIALAGLVMGGIPSFAQVMDVSADGSVTIFSGAAVIDANGVRPLAAIPATAQPAANANLGGLIAAAAQRYALDPGLLKAVAWKESRYRHDAVSAKGAVGVMQLMPGTARILGVDPHDMSQNIQGGAAYLRQMMDRYSGDTSLALAAYNAGPGAVDHYRAVPPFAETRDYVRVILGSAPKAANAAASLAVLVNR